MTPDEELISVLIAACAKDVSTRILTTAKENELEPLSFLVNVAAVLASSALAAQPENQLQTASRHIQDALGLVHCLRDAEEADPPVNKPFINTRALQ